MTSGEKAEPERSAISSTETPFKWCERCGHHRDDHGTPDRHCVWMLCACQRLSGGPFGFEVKEKPECEHPNKQHTGSVYDGSGGRKTWLYYTCPDCKAHLKEEELDEPEKPEPRCEGCGHPEHSGFCRELEMPGPPGDVDECGCLDDREPPLTPEEHNLGPEGVDCVFDACPRDPDDCDNGCRAAADELSREASEMACQDCLAGVHGPNAHRETPPQPDRRPPYLLAYSVQGHLYEVALPGDATVAALDGRLVITHHLGPVAGICQIAPITSEESTR
jgi:hypothetical protein